MIEALAIENNFIEAIAVENSFIEAIAEVVT